MDNAYQVARETVVPLISNEREHNEGLLDPAVIAEKVDQVLPIISGSENVDRDALIAELESLFSVWIEDGVTLSSRDDEDNHVPWLYDRRGRIEWHYWDRYRRHLMRSGWPEATTLKLGDLTDDTLDRLEDPLREGPWDRRGMVVGHVQSGKTANYTGLVCKAADAGYKLIIVLAGLTNSLRSQTQMRLDEGFLGYDSGPYPDGGPRKPVGVGLLPSGTQIRTFTATNKVDDFKAIIARQRAMDNPHDPLLFVVKKNASILNALLGWIEWAADTARDEDGNPFLAHRPLLLIDDEADHGSINTNQANIVAKNADADDQEDEDLDPTRLNSLVRQILKRVGKSSYVGYTATPFANIFIHEQEWTDREGEDLFPRSFITYLPSPSNYFGPAKIFGLRSDDYAEFEDESHGLPIFRPIRDHAISMSLTEKEGWMPPRPPDRTEHVPRYNGAETIPPSLAKAIDSFILACAVRKFRGQEGEHNSMLIHVTQYVNVQNRVGEQVSVSLHETVNGLRYQGDGNPESCLERMKAVWESDFVPTSQAMVSEGYEAPPWDRISEQLMDVAAGIQIRAVNGEAGDVLDYAEHSEHGLTVIAIGGAKLSRGLTLEGLTVSYFLRTSKMYDTLMQMGRWFGYRPGYMDVCRIYTTPTLLDWYEHITRAASELNSEFLLMKARGGTPRDYGLRVRSHPTLQITSRAKMRNGTEMQLSFAGDIPETIIFSRAAVDVENNYEATVSLIKGMMRDGAKQTVSPKRRRPDDHVFSWAGSVCWEGVSAEQITRFFAAYRTHPAAPRVNNDRLRQYVEKQIPNKNLLNWTVLLASGQGKPSDEFPCGEMRLVKRDWSARFKERHPDLMKKPDTPFVIGRIGSPRDESIDLDLSEYAKALQLTIDAWRETNSDGKPGDKGYPKTPSGPAIRMIRPTRNAVLILYPLDPVEITKSEESPLPVVGFAISFPSNGTDDEEVVYVVDNVYMQQEFEGLG